MDGTNILMPTAEEISRWMRYVTQHVQHIEYFLHELGIGAFDPQRPHDIMGEGNKFEWEVMAGFAVHHRDTSPEFFQSHVYPALARHRCQYHHVKWNGVNDKATPDDMKLGAVDAICSLLEPRAYQGGPHTYDQVLVIAHANPPHHERWLSELVPEMRKLARPRIERITSLDAIPNIGIPKDVHDILCGRIEDTRRYLKEAHGFIV